MKLNWHEIAARCAAAHPSWSWSQVCAAVGRRKPARRAKPAVRAYAAKLEQLKLW